MTQPQVPGFVEGGLTPVGQTATNHDTPHTLNDISGAAHDMAASQVPIAGYNFVPDGYFSGNGAAEDIAAREAIEGRCRLWPAGRGEGD